ncbi:hypothetical protein EJ08DRAFT_592309 [Tothia fuscella]|uniref:tRNA wybutosine-synthesizing protein 2 n=1 Tax=Tothia fuscella TaxID=1048955 RepID=A0A9P4NML8_9PEZI|nr:hypothetical protein EJ08DRAFT_592309 [Tothia fuscella]
MRKADNLFSKGVRVGLQELSPELLDSLHVSEESLIRELPGNYSLYPPLLLLPKHTFAGDQWRALLLKLPDAQLYKFFKCMATAMSVTHVALNAPIPPSNNSKENILRSPTSLSPLYGDFGPVVTSINPIAEDFRSAFWVSTRQNGITQVWAPRYTMFSRGNITEKARVLALPSVREAVQQGRDDSRGCAAVDLYAGIGYFAFSYAKAGVSKVYCWELNPWSVEGFRRGAEQNKWGVQVIDDDLSGDEIALADAATFAVFKMDNLKAGPIIECSRKSIPPVRHVNCGLLPTSKGSWETAVKVLDPDLGGWLYLHENIAVHDVNVRSVEIHEEIQEMVNQKWVRERRTASLEHVERVKTYAPGIMHCVLDIRIS